MDEKPKGKSQNDFYFLLLTFNLIILWWVVEDFQLALMCSRTGQR